MNSFTITMYKYVIRMTIWALLGVWTASVRLESHPLTKWISQTMHCLWLVYNFSVCHRDDIIQSWRRKKRCQAQRWNESFLGEAGLYAARPFGVHFDQLQSSISRFDKLDGEASAGRSLLLSGYLTDGLHPVTVCYFAWKSALCSF